MAHTRVFDGSAYAPEKILGAGAMGQVWQVRHRELGKSFAAKVLNERLVGNDRHVERIRAEARALAKLEHPNLVRVFDLGCSKDGRYYFVMDLLAGSDLDRVLQKRGTLPVAEAIDITCQALLGVAAAHDVGLVHRDLKPANLFLCETQGDSPVVKVVDFGVAKHDPVSDDAPATPTAVGMVMGTPRYVSPEMCLGRPVDARADIYAMGLVLYRMLAGRGPFDDAKGVTEVLTAHVKTAAPAPSTFSSTAISPLLDAVVLRALEKEPDARYPSAQAFAAALRPLARLAEDDATSATAHPRPAFLRHALTEVITEPLADGDLTLPSAAAPRARALPEPTEPWDPPAPLHSPPSMAPASPLPTHAPVQVGRPQGALAPQGVPEKLAAMPGAGAQHHVRLWLLAGVVLVVALVALWIL